MRKPKNPKAAKKAKPAKPATPAIEEVSGEASSETPLEAGPGTEPEAPAEPEAADAPAREAVAQDDVQPAETPPDDLAPEDRAPEDHAPEDQAPDSHAPEDDARDEEHGHRTLAATALMILLGIIFIASLALWAAPKLAPYLPASVAVYLVPGQADIERRLADLDEAVAAEAAKSETAIAALNSEIAALGARLDTAADANQTEAALAAAQSASAAAEAAAAETASLAARLDAIKAEVAALGEELAALSAALAAAGDNDGATAPEVAAAVAALSTRLDSLAATVEGDTAVEALEQRIAALGVRLDAVEASAADARDVQSEALDEVSTTIRQARLQAAVDLLTSRLTGGLPYAAKLDEIAAMTGTAPPPPLAAGAATGLATAAALEASFARHARAAVAADIQAGDGEGTGLRALSWLRAQVAGRPVDETEGDSAGAVTSRVAARVREGKLAEALAETETLSEPARAGLGDWLDRLRARVAADTALADWRAQIGVGG